jgi:hypothetical protein
VTELEIYMNLIMPNTNAETMAAIAILVLLGVLTLCYAILLFVRRSYRRKVRALEDMLSIFPGRSSMECPCCRSRLVKGKEQKQFETLNDHVSDPNEDSPRPFRDVYRCQNSLCEARRRMLFWSEDGEGPYGVIGDSIVWIDNNYGPFNSHARRMHFQISYHDEDRSLRCRWFMVKREVTYESNFHGDKVGKRVKYSWWFFNRNVGCQCHYTSGLKMFLFELRLLRRNTWNRRDEVRGVMERSRLKRAEWWRKAAALWVKVFYRKYLLPRGASKANG